MPALPVSVLAVLAAATTLTFSYYSRSTLLRRDQPGAPALAALMAVLSVVPIVVLGVQQLDVRQWYLFPTLLFYVYGPLWVWFVLTYIGEEHPVSWGKLVLFMTPPIVGAVNVTTILVDPQFESNLTATLRLVTDLYVFALLFGGILLLVRAGYTLASTDTRRTLSLALGALLPVLVPLMAGAYVGGTPVLDSYLVGYALSAVLFGTVFHNGDLFQSVPVAEAIGRDIVVTEMDDGVIVVDGDGRAVDVNPAARELLALDEGPIRNDPVESLFAADVALPADGESTEIPVADGTRILDVSATSLSDPVEGRVGRILTIRDVTERVRRRQQLERLNRQNERLDQFVSVVSHDLRNPLTVASGFLDMARDTGDDEHFEKIADAHDRIETMLEELLTMAQAGITADEREQVALDHIVMEAWKTAQTPDATLELELEGGETVEADRTLLRHVLENLFRNAAEHNDHPVTVTVGLLADGSEGFYVADDGTGIPAEEHEAVFEHGHTTAEDGTGFGLSIVEQFVVAHGWDISVIDSEAGGARFEIVDVAVTVE